MHRYDDSSSQTSSPDRLRSLPNANLDLRHKDPRAPAPLDLLDIATDSPDAAERLRSEFYQALQRLAQAGGSDLAAFLATRAGSD